MSEIDKDDEGIKIDTQSLSVAAVDEQQKESEEKEEPKTIESELEWSDEIASEMKAYVERTLEQSLRTKYDDIDTTSFDLVLSVQPIFHGLQSAYVIPVLTRESSTKDPALKETYRELDKAIAERTATYDEIEQMVHELRSKSENPGARTIVADVIVACKERFLIKDKQTGEIVQGSEEDQDVVHLVRFEMETSKGNDGRRFGDWKITDWDDLLEGNLFY